MISLSTHVLDTASGSPAPGIDVVLEFEVNGSWDPVGRGITDAGGRIGDLAVGLKPGMYRVRFDTGGYGNVFFPEVHIVCNLEEGEGHYHVPLLLSPYGYTTYRGS